LDTNEKHLDPLANRLCEVIYERSLRNRGHNGVDLLTRIINHPQTGKRLMAEQVHGREVKQMAMASGKSMTRASLHQEIIDKFGEETRFYSCAAENMTADELISFFEDNGKLDLQDYRFEACEGHEH